MYVWRADLARYLGRLGARARGRYRSCPERPNAYWRIQMIEKAAIKDDLSAQMGSKRKPLDRAGIVGHGTYELRGPDGEVKQVGEFVNLITDRGDEYYAKLGAGESEDEATGMKLGTDDTAPSKAGAGAAIVSYVSGSNTDFDSKSTSDLGGGNGHRIQHVASWAAGDATETGIVEAVITNQTPNGDTAGAASNTIARGLLDPIVNKGEDDTLTVTWNHDLLGA